jgi:hypothetical protein
MLALGTGGAGAIAMSFGAIALIGARHARDEAIALGCTHDLSVCAPGDALSTAERAHFRGNLATGFLVGGGVAVVVGLALWIEAPDDPSSWSVAPAADANDGTIVVGRGF